MPHVETNVYNVTEPPTSREVRFAYGYSFAHRQLLPLTLSLPKSEAPQPKPRHISVDATATHLTELGLPDEAKISGRALGEGITDPDANVVIYLNPDPSQRATATLTHIVD